MPQAFENFAALRNYLPMSTYNQMMQGHNSNSNNNDYILYNMDSSDSVSSSSSPVSTPVSYLSPEYQTAMSPSYGYDINVSKPHLRIIEQPVDKFRFRYKSEMLGTHGSLIGAKNSTSRKKTAPTVELFNYNGPATIRCTLFTSNPKDRIQHAHKLVRRSNESDEIGDPHDIEVSEADGYRASFFGMGIIHTAKKNIKEVLKEKLEWKYHEEGNKHYTKDPLPVRLKAKIATEAENAQKSMNLNSVALRFEALAKVNGVWEPIGEPVYSHAINNLKSALTGELKICRVDKCSGSCQGNDEVFMLVEKVGRKNIHVRFFELDDEENEIWSANGQFSELDVHHQYAIVFRTPPYRDLNITKSKEVFIKLYRPSDGDCSEPINFRYTPSEKMQNRKRQKLSSDSEELIRAAFAESSGLPLEDVLGSESFSTTFGNVASLPSTELMVFYNNIDETEYVTLLPPDDQSYLVADGCAEDEDDDDCTVTGNTDFARQTVLDILKTMKEKDPVDVKRQVLSLLKERTTFSDTPLHHALHHDQRDAITYLLSIIASDPSYRESVNLQNTLGKTPLHYAVQKKKNVKVTNALLRLGANPNACDDKGMSPLLTAVQVRNNGEIVEELIKHDSDVECVNEAGRTALQLAVESGSIQAVKALVKAKVDVNKIDMLAGQTALHIAVAGCHREITEYLLKNANVDVNKKNFSGNTALHSAVVCTSSAAKEMVKLLIKYGADPKIKNNCNSRDEDTFDDFGNGNVKKEVESDNEVETGEGQSSFDLARANPAILHLLENKDEEMPEVRDVDIKDEEIKSECKSDWLESDVMEKVTEAFDELGLWKELSNKLNCSSFLDSLKLTTASVSTMLLLNYAIVNNDLTIHEFIRIIGDFNNRLPQLKNYIQELQELAKEQ